MILSIKGTVTVDSREDNKHGLICISLLFKRMLEVQKKIKNSCNFARTQKYTKLTVISLNNSLV